MAAEWEMDGMDGSTEAADENNANVKMNTTQKCKHAILPWIVYVSLSYAPQIC